MDKNQVIFIRGGEAFDNKEEYYNYLKAKEYNPYKNMRNWRDWLEWSLSESFDLFAPIMPNKQWADYKAWKIWFEKIFPYLNDQKLILIGQSLGGLFIAKYLSENNFPQRIDQLHLVSPVFNDQGLVGEKTTTFELIKDNIPSIGDKAKKIFIYHSIDDPLVPVEHSKKYLNYLKNAEFHSFDNRGHFNQPAFMEILEVINKNL